MVNKKQTVIINGKTYDASSGRPLTPKSPPKAHIISDIMTSNIKKPAVKRASVADIARKERSVAPHTKPRLQKSTTLRRSTLKKPVASMKPSATKARRHVQKSPSVTKFASQKPEPSPKPRVDQDLLAQTRALEKAQAEYLAHKEQQKVPINPKEIKEHILKKAVENVPTQAINSHQIHHHGRKKINRRFASTAMTGAALLLLGGYLTYINIPNLSIKVAAINSGVDASLPSYQPSGYRINGPITYNTDEVNVKYKQAGTNASYKLTQRPTDWDPIATLDNYVEGDSKNDYQIHSVQGLTVYTYDKKAVWVNDGKLHIIAGNAPLSNQQVEHIVASM